MNFYVPSFGLCYGTLREELQDYIFDPLSTLVLPYCLDVWTVWRLSVPEYARADPLVAHPQRIVGLGIPFDYPPIIKTIGIYGTKISILWRHVLADCTVSAFCHIV